MRNTYISLSSFFKFTTFVLYSERILRRANSLIRYCVYYANSKTLQYNRCENWIWIRAVFLYNIFVTIFCFKKHCNTDGKTSFFSPFLSGLACSSEAMFSDLVLVTKLIVLADKFRKLVILAVNLHGLFASVRTTINYFSNNMWNII